jgi:hypothetical protein
MPSVSPLTDNLTRPSDIVTRPSECPYCRGKAVGTLAKVYTAKTMWSCGKCHRTWTLAAIKAGR